jgi:hypothetical protein
MSNLTEEQQAAIDRFAQEFAAVILPIVRRKYEQAQSNEAQVIGEQ